MDPEAQGVPTPQDPQATPDPAPAADPTPAPPAPEVTGPWADKLNSRFEDASLRGQVDQFLREEIQPYVTRLEQRPDLPEGAQQLWNDITGENPLQAYLQLTAELYGPEAAQAVYDNLSDLAGDGEDPALPVDDGDQPLDPRVQALIDAEEERLYEGSIAQALTANGIPEDYRELLDPLVVAEGGNIDSAATKLKAKLEAKGLLGEQPPTVDDVPEPPPHAGPTPPPAVPTEKTYDSLESAVDDFFAERRAAQAPPTIGQV